MKVQSAYRTIQLFRRLDPKDHVIFSDLPFKVFIKDGPVSNQVHQLVIHLEININTNIINNSVGVICLVGAVVVTITIAVVSAKTCITAVLLKL